MNPTDTEIQQALRERAKQAATAAEVLPKLGSRTARRPHQHLRSAITVASAVAGVAAVAVVAMLVANSQDSRHAASPKATPSSTEPPASTTHPAPAPAHFDPRSYYFRMAPLPGFVVTQHSSTLDTQQISVDPTGGQVVAPGEISISGEVLLWSADGSTRQKPRRPAGAKDVSVNGRPGFYGLINYGGEIQPVLVWQYAPNAWGMIVGDSFGIENGKRTGISLASALAWAKAVRPAERQVIRFPARFGYLPAGLSCWEIDPATKIWAAQPPPTHTSGPIRLSTVPPSATAPPPIDPARLSTTVIFVTSTSHNARILEVDVRGTAWPRQKGGTPVVVNGLRGTWNAKAHALEVYGRDYLIRLVSANLAANPYLQAELTKVAEQMTVAPSWADQATWFDAATALPR